MQITSAIQKQKKKKKLHEDSFSLQINLNSDQHLQQNV